MMEEQQAAKYISSLKYSIKERVILHEVFSVDEAHNKALKIERLQSRTLLSKPLMPIEETTTEASTAAPVTTADLIAKDKENPHAKSDVDMCYRCGHKSNECPKRKQVNMVDCEEEEEEELEIDHDDSNIAEEHG